MNSKKLSDVIEEYYDNFLKKLFKVNNYDFDDLIMVMNAAKYLDIKALLILTCAQVADVCNRNSKKTKKIRNFLLGKRKFI